MAVVRTLQVVLIATILAVEPGCVHRVAPPPTPLPITQFLKSFPAIYQTQQGTVVSYDGRIEHLSPTLEASLTSALPEYHFQVAKMSFMHWGPEPVDLLLVTRRDDDSVVAYSWSLWFDNPSPSFSYLLPSDPARLSDPGPILEAISQALAEISGYRSGPVTFEAGEADPTSTVRSRMSVTLFDAISQPQRIISLQFSKYGSATLNIDAPQPVA